MRYLIILKLFGAAFAGFVKPLLQDKAVYANANIAAEVVEADKSNLSKRGSIGASCSDVQIAHLKAAMSRCKAFADQAYYAIESNKELRRRYFKTDSLKHVNSIRRAYVQIENACDIKRQNIPFKCKNSEGSCTPRCHAYIHPGKDKVYLCTPFFENNVDGAAKTLIHELSHLDSIRETNDHAYGDDKSKGLCKEKCLSNADNFAFFAYHAYGASESSDNHNHSHSGGGDGSDGGGDGSDGGGDGSDGGGDGSDGGGDPYPHITYPPFRGGGDGGTGYGNRDGDGGGDPSPYITYPPFKGGDSWHYG